MPGQKKPSFVTPVVLILIAGVLAVGVRKWVEHTMHNMSGSFGYFQADRLNTLENYVISADVVAAILGLSGLVLLVRVVILRRSSSGDSLCSESDTGDVALQPDLVRCPFCNQEHRLTIVEAKHRQFICPKCKEGVRMHSEGV